MDQAPEGLRVMLNEIRATAIENNTLYGRSVDMIQPDTPFAAWAAPLLTNDNVMNEFIPELLQRIVKTSVEIKYFNNPLRRLEGEEIPLGQTVQEIATNPVQGRQFDPNDFAGILCKYEPDVKVQFMGINANWQYPMSVSYDNIRDAFVSWYSLNQFIESQVAAIYNGFYIDDFQTTKGLIGAAFSENMVVAQEVAEVTDEASAKALIRTARGLALNMALPSTAYNAWSQNGGAGNPYKTWTNPEDLVVLVRNDVLAQVDVDVLAAAFNINNTKFLGTVIGVDNFNQYDQEGNMIFDGSAIVMAIGDRRWFKINPQMMKFDQQYNANNTTWQYYLRVRKMYKYSFLANMVVLTTEMPEVTAQGIAATPATLTLNAGGQSKLVRVNLTPAQATDEVTYSVTAGTASQLTLTPSDNGRSVRIRANADATGEYTVQAKAGSVQTDITVTVNPAAAALAAKTSTKVANAVKGE